VPINCKVYELMDGCLIDASPFWRSLREIYTSLCRCDITKHVAPKVHQCRSLLLTLRWVVYFMERSADADVALELRLHWVVYFIERSADGRVDMELRLASTATIFLHLISANASGLLFSARLVVTLGGNYTFWDR
jgi:hypothetical protein